MGYPFGKKGWKLFDLDAREFFVSRDVKFFEDIFPFVHPDKANITPHTIVPICNEINDEFTPVLDPDFSPEPQISPNSSLDPHTEPISSTPPNSPSGSHSPQITPSTNPSQPPTGPPPADPPTSPSGPPFDISPGSLSNAPSGPLISGPHIGCLSSTSPTNNSTLPTNLPPSFSSGPNSVGPSTPLVSTSPSPSIPSSSPPDLGRGLRTKVPYVLLRDFVTNSVVVQSPFAPLRLYSLLQVLPIL